MKFVKSFFEEGAVSENINQTLITLIPKLSKPEMMTHFRPISLCYVI